MASDRAKANASMKKKYPQMYDKDGDLKPKYRKKKKTTWAGKLKGMVKGELAARKAKKKDKPAGRTMRSKQVESSLKDAGVTEKEMKRLR